MRHFLQSALAPLAVGTLASGVAAGPTTGALVAATGPEDRFPAGNLRAPLAAVDLSTVAPPADLHLPAAPRAAVESIALLDHRNPATRRTGQRGGVAAS